MNAYRDPVTRRYLSDEEVSDQQTQWEEGLKTFTREIEPDKIEPDEIKSDRLDQLLPLIYQELKTLSTHQLGQRPPIPPCDHAPESNLVDHSLLTSALIYCLAPNNEKIQLARLAALSHEFPAEARAMLQTKLASAEDQAWMEQAWATLQTQAQRLNQSNADSLSVLASAAPNSGDELLDTLWYAHLATSQPLFNQSIDHPDGGQLRVIASRADFQRHPLASFESRIGLVYGGATKVKQYVFESAKLPELRGASVLLDKLNLDYSQKLFEKAPECIIYAAGGDVLALTPMDQAAKIANKIEARYTEQTLSAQSVAASATVSLLELQYGLDPQKYWADDYLHDLGQGNQAKQDLLHSYYGNPDHKGQQWTDELLFHTRKCFGELVTHVSLKRTARREGNQVGESERPILHFETLPHAQFCSSCDRRPAIARIPDLEDDLCEPCLRKRWIGWRTRYGDEKEMSKVMEKATTWRPKDFEDEMGENSFEAWHIQFGKYLDDCVKNEQLSQAVRDKIMRQRDAYLAGYQDISPAYTFDEIGKKASPDGYLGIVYADGNNVGALIERIRTPAEYRQFSQRLFDANQWAVFKALAKHLRPQWVEEEKEDKEKEVLIHPFEIISIGGDDLFLIVPAEKALPIALDISSTLERLFADDDNSYEEQASKAQRAQKFEQQTIENQEEGAQQAVTSLGKPGVSMSTGVILAPQSTPFFFLTELAEELLKNAKHKAKKQKERGDYGSAIDFMALKSVSMVTTKIKSFRQAALTERRNSDVLHLTARPYTAAEMGILIECVEKLKEVDFPGSQLHQLREMLPRGLFVTSLNYLYFTSRLKPLWRALLRYVLDDAWCDPQKYPVPWTHQKASRQGPHWETVLGDMIELYDFVEKPQSEN